MAKRSKKQKEDVLEPEVLGPSDEAPAKSKPALELSPSAESQTDTMAVVPVTALQQYLAEVRRYPYLSKEEELRLFHEYRTHGSRDAAVKLIMANLRVSISIAAEYLHTGADHMDLIQEGNVGLMHAIKKFDPSKNVRFYAYAAWWSRAYILRYLLNNYRLVKIGTTQDQRKLFYNLKKEKAKLEREGFAPDTKLLADRLNVRERDVIEMGSGWATGSSRWTSPSAKTRRGSSSMSCRPSRFRQTSNLRRPNYRHSSERSLPNSSRRSKNGTKISCGTGFSQKPRSHWMTLAPNTPSPKNEPGNWKPVSSNVYATILRKTLKISTTYESNAPVTLIRNATWHIRFSIGYDPPSPYSRTGGRISQFPAPLTWTNTGLSPLRVQRIRTSARSGVPRLRHRVRTCSTSSIFTGLTSPGGCCYEHCSQGEDREEER